MHSRHQGDWKRNYPQCPLACEKWVVSWVSPAWRDFHKNADYCILSAELLTRSVSEEEDVGHGRFQKDKSRDAWERSFLKPCRNLDFCFLSCKTEGIWLFCKNSWVSHRHFFRSMKLNAELIFSESCFYAFSLNVREIPRTRYYLCFVEVFGGYLYCCLCISVSLYLHFAFVQVLLFLHFLFMSALCMCI